MRGSILLAHATLLAMLIASCSPPEEGVVTGAASGTPETPNDPTVAPTASTPHPIVEMVAVGDIGNCEADTDDAVAAAVLEEEPAVVALLGDLVYPAGTTQTYRDCFLPSWHEVVELARPAVGNHDLKSDGGAAYWEIFGDRAGEPTEGWYSYDIGAWHVVVLNSNCELGICGPDSPQHDWLVTDLAATDADCVLAYWHHPMTSSGFYGRYPPVDPLWVASVEGGVDLVLTGHEHYYERLAPLGADVVPDPDGVPLIMAGTGGVELRPRGEVVSGSEVIIDDAFGYLRLELAPDKYEFEFMALDGAVRDSGAGSCTTGL